MFIGRNEEMRVLADLFNSPTSTLAVIYGRRRIGKSTLIQKAAEDSGRPSVYFQATRDVPYISIEAFKAAVAQEIGGDPVMDGLRDWSSILHHLAERTKALPGLIVALDEFPYLCDADPALPSIIQKFVDSKSAKESSLKLVLCGSIISAMEHLISGKSPLYGRSAIRLDLRQLPLRDITGFLPGYTPHQIIETYSVFGGVPFHLEKLSDRHGVSDNIRNMLLSRFGALIDEPETLMLTEVREPAKYNGILSAIAAGRTKASEIADALGASGIHPYVEQLESMRLVVRMMSVNAKPNSRDTRYLIADPLTLFWYAFIKPNLSAIMAGHGERVWQSRITGQFPAHVGLVFEELCRDHVRRHGDEFLPDIPRMIGKLWRRGDFDIDVAGELLDKSHVFGEAKWTGDAIGNTVLNILQERAISSGYGGGSHRHFVLFSKAGFTESLVKRAALERNIHLVKPMDMVLSHPPG